MKMPLVILQNNCRGYKHRDDLVTIQFLKTIDTIIKTEQTTTKKATYILSLFYCNKTVFNISSPLPFYSNNEDEIDKLSK